MNHQYRLQLHPPLNDYYAPHGGLYRTYVKHKTCLIFNKPKQNNQNQQKDGNKQKIQISNNNFINITEQDNKYIKFIKLLTLLQLEINNQNIEKSQEHVENMYDLINEDQHFMQYHAQLYNYITKNKQLTQNSFYQLKTILKSTVMQLQNRPYQIILLNFDSTQLQDKVQCEFYFSEYLTYTEGQKFITNSYFLYLCCKFSIDQSFTNYDKLITEYNRSQTVKLQKIKDIYQAQQIKTLESQRFQLLLEQSQMNRSQSRYSYDVKDIFGSKNNSEQQNQLPKIIKSQSQQQEELKQQQQYQQQDLPQINKQQVVDEIENNNLNFDDQQLKTLRVEETLHPVDQMISNQDTEKSNVVQNLQDSQQIQTQAQQNNQIQNHYLESDITQSEDTKQQTKQTDQQKMQELQHLSDSDSFDSFDSDDDQPQPPQPQQQTQSQYQQSYQQYQQQQPTQQYQQEEQKLNYTASPEQNNNQMSSILDFDFD